MMTAQVANDNETTATRALELAIGTLRAHGRSRDGGLAMLQSERALLSMRILAGAADLRTVARFEDVNRAIEAARVLYGQKRTATGESRV